MWLLTTQASLGKDWLCPAGGAEEAQARAGEALAGIHPLPVCGRLRHQLPLPEKQKLLREVLRLLAGQVRHPLPGLRLQVRLPLQDLPLLCCRYAPPSPSCLTQLVAPPQQGGLVT